MPADTSAAALAKSVVEGGEASLPALLAALKASGIAVRDLDGSTLRDPAEPPIGLAWLAGYVVGIARIEAGNNPMPAADFMRMLSIAFHGPDDDATAADLVAALKADVRTAMASDVPTVRYWGTFMNELGRQGAGRYDMRSLDRSSASPEEIAMASRPIVLDPVQGLMILTAMLGAVQSASATAAVYRGGPAPRVQLAADTPCGDMSREVEFVAYGVEPMTIGYVVGKIYERIGGSVLRAAERLGVAAILLTIIRFVMEQLSMEMVLELVGNPPVIRTDSNDYDGTPGPGETRRLTAKVGYKLPKLQYLQCLANYAALLGIDTGIARNGGWPDAIVTWHIEPDPVGASPGDYWLKILQFAGGGCGGTRCETTTDSAGETHVDIEGIRQPFDNAGTPRLHAMRRHVLVRYTVSKQADIFDNLLLLATVGLGIATGGVGLVAAAITAAIEAGQRMGARSQELLLEVKDWDWCAPGATKWEEGSLGTADGGRGGVIFADFPMWPPMTAC